MAVINDVTFTHIFSTFFKKKVLYDIQPAIVLELVYAFSEPLYDAYDFRIKIYG